MYLFSAMLGLDFEQKLAEMKITSVCLIPANDQTIRPKRSVPAVALPEEPKPEVISIDMAFENKR